MNIFKWLRKLNTPKAPNIPKVQGDPLFFQLGIMLYEQNEEIRKLRSAAQAAEPREE